MEAGLVVPMPMPPLNIEAAVEVAFRNPKVGVVVADKVNVYAAPALEIAKSPQPELLFTALNVLAA